MGSLSLRFLLPVLLVAATACGGTTGAAVVSPTASARPITSIQMAHDIATDGSAKSPATTFNSSSDQKVVAVLTLANLEPGTKISYTRYLDGKYVNSKTAKLAKRAKYFYFIFTPKAGAKFTPGTYKMRFYVNDKRAGETTFKIT